MIKALGFAAALLFPAVAISGAYKCVSDSGAIEFSDKPCLGAKSVEGVKIQDSQITAPPRSMRHSYGAGGDPHTLQLDTLVLKALAAKDYAKAKDLAVTKDHWLMIQAAEREAAQRKADVERRRPIFCSGSSMNHGYVTTTNTVCR